VHGIVAENGNGTYVVEYAVTSSGLYDLSVTLHGRHIAGSPFAVQTFPAAARSSHSSAFGAGLARATAGRLAEFNILAKDIYGNAEHASAGGNFSVVLSGPEVPSYLTAPYRALPRLTAPYRALCCQAITAK